MVHARRTSLAALLIPLLASGCTRGKATGFETVELVHRVSGRQERETFAFGPEAVRIRRPDGTWIFRYADRSVLVLDPAAKTWTETRLDALLADPRIRGLRAEVPGLDGGGIAGLEIERDLETTTIAGLEATLTKIRGDGFEVDLWLSDDLPIPGPRRPTFDFLQAIGGPLALPATAFDYLEGFPVRSIVRVRGGPFGEMKETRMLLEVHRASPPAEAFTIPPDFHRAD